MKRIYYITFFAILTLGVLASTACGRHDSETAAVPYTTEALYNYQTAKNYQAAGRYELAKEHFTLALAAETNPDMREAIIRDIESVNMMIQTLR